MLGCDMERIDLFFFPLFPFLFFGVKVQFPFCSISFQYETFSVSLLYTYIYTERIEKGTAEREKK